MNKKILSWLLLLFGEAIIIAAFILFRGEMPTNILVLNITVSSILYGLFFFTYRIPWINTEEKSQKQIGSLGISWLATWIYALFAIGVIVVGYFLPELTFKIQLVIHCGLLFLLLMWLLLAQRSADKVQEVFQQQTQNRSGINEMKTAMQSLKDKINVTDGLPEYFTKQIDMIEENLRFISPADNSEAYGLENSFVEIVNEINFAVTDFSMNEERIENNIKKLERIYQNRKNIYSN